MLPSYNTTPRRYPLRSFSRQPHALSLRDRLLANSRVTNLGLVLICSILGLSLFSNLRYAYLLSNYESRTTVATIPKLITDTVAYNSSEPRLDHLIVVAGHAIWKGGSPSEFENDSEWVLDVAQAGHGNPRAFYAHIAKGAEIARKDEHSLLVFSGQVVSICVDSYLHPFSGQTRKPTHLTEGQSYLSLALASGLLPSTSEPFPRATTEDFALDSYQNLLFSIARFRERAGRYPKRITVVGFGVKKERFEKLHARAIRWPTNKIEYVGVDVAVKQDLEVSKAGELKYGFTPYTQDLYGCHDFLAAKRRSRNTGARFHPYHTSAPELAHLLDWCPASRHQLFPGPLPWSR